jgi:hypothetical protein
VQANTPVFVLTFIDPGATLIRKEENDIGAKSLSLCSSQCYTKAAQCSSVGHWSDREVNESNDQCAFANPRQTLCLVSALFHARLGYTLGIWATKDTIVSLSMTWDQSISYFYSLPSQHSYLNLVQQISQAKPLSSGLVWRKTLLYKTIGSSQNISNNVYF